MDFDKNVPKMETSGFHPKSGSEEIPAMEKKAFITWEDIKRQKDKLKKLAWGDYAEPAEKVKQPAYEKSVRPNEGIKKSIFADSSKRAKTDREFSWGGGTKKNTSETGDAATAEKPVRRALPPIVKGLAVIAAVAAMMLVIKGVDNPVTNTLEDGIQAALGTTLSPDEDIGKLKFVFNDEGQTAQYVYRSSLEKPVDGTLASADVNGHAGMVFMADSGSIVRAAAPGMITASGVDQKLGRFVRISHPSGLETVYYGLQEITAGGYVERLQEIGKLAEDRLYFEVYQDGRLIDPAPYFE